MVVVAGSGSLMYHIWQGILTTFIFVSLYLSGQAFSQHHHLLGLWDIGAGVIFIAQFYINWDSQQKDN